MSYSTEPKFRKYVKGYGFLSFAKTFKDKYGKKLLDAATKTGIDAAKTASKRVVQKTAEATADLIGNKIADKITSIGKTKEKEKENTNKPEEIYIPPEKRQQIIDDLKLFWIIIIIMKLNIFYCHCHWDIIIILIIIIILLYNNRKKIINLLDITSDDKDLPSYVTKKWVEVYDQSEKKIQR